jgi:hypothetical protein
MVKIPPPKWLTLPEALKFLESSGLEQQPAKDGILRALIDNELKIRFGGEYREGDTPKFETWEQRFKEGRVDWTTGMVKVLQHVGQTIELKKLPIVVKISLESIATHFAIESGDTNANKEPAYSTSRYISPYVRLILDAIENIPIIDGEQPLKKVLIEWFEDQAKKRSIKMSANIAKMMATIVRSPDSQMGGNKPRRPKKG